MARNDGYHTAIYENKIVGVRWRGTDLVKSGGMPMEKIELSGPLAPSLAEQLVRVGEGYGWAHDCKIDVPTVEERWKAAEDPASLLEMADSELSIALVKELVCLLPPGKFYRRDQWAATVEHSHGPCTLEVVRDLCLQVETYRILKRRDAMNSIGLRPCASHYQEQIAEEKQEINDTICALIRKHCKPREK